MTDLNTWRDSLEDKVLCDLARLPEYAHARTVIAWTHNLHVCEVEKVLESLVAKQWIIKINVRAMAADIQCYKITKSGLELIGGAA